MGLFWVFFNIKLLTLPPQFTTENNEMIFPSKALFIGIILIYSETKIYLCRWKLFTIKI